MKKIFLKKNNLILASIVLFVLFSFSNITLAEINPLMNFQGKIINSDGTSLAEGTYDLRFELFDVARGGASLWSENLTASTTLLATIASSSTDSLGLNYLLIPSQATNTIRVGQYLTNQADSASVLITNYSTTTNIISVASGSPVWANGVTVNNRPRVEGGVINWDLGVVSDLSGIDFNQTLYLEATFNGETMQPRRMISSVAQSFNSSMLDGRDGSEYAVLSDDEVVAGAWSFDNILNITASSTNSALTITQNGNGSLLDVKNGATTTFAVLNDGRVAIGSYILPASRGTAGYVLKTDSSGNVSWQVDLAGFGGSGLWATSSNNTIIRPVDVAQIVVIGDTSTTSNGYIFEVEGSSWLDDVVISDESNIRFYDAGNTNYFAFKASSTVDSNVIVTLPTNSYSQGDAMMINSDGDMFWGKAATLWTDSGTDVYFNGGNVSIGTNTPSGLFTIGNTSNSQFIVNSSGEIVDGRWTGDVLEVAYGGIGTTTPDGILYGDGAGGLHALTNNSVNWNIAYSWGDHSVEGYFSTTTSGILDVAYGGIGTSTPDGILYGDGLGSINTLVDNSVDWNMAYSWGDHSTEGYFSTSTDGVLAVAFGGTGTTTFQANYLVYAQDANTLGQVTGGANGEILQLISGIPEWVGTSSLGIDFNGIGGMLDTDAGGTGQNSEAWTGVAFVNSGIWSATSVLAIQYGGTGATSFSDLFQLGTDTTGNYLVNVIGTSSIVVTGSLGEAATRIIDVVDNSIKADELAVAGDGTNGQILTSDGSGEFTWIDSGSVDTDTTLTREQVEDFAGNLIATTTGSHDKLTITYNPNGGAAGNIDFSLDDDLSGYDNTSSNFITTASLSSTAIGLDYSNGVFSYAAGYQIPTSTRMSEWDSAYSTITASSSSWESTHDTVSASSANWDSAFDTITASSSDWEGTYLIVNNNQADWDSAFNTVTASSSFWDEAYGWGDHSLVNYFNLDGGALSVSEGGTGRDSWATGSLIIASSSTELGEILKSASSSMILSINPSGNYEWISKDDAGHTLTQGEVEDYAGNLLERFSSYDAGLLSITYDEGTNVINFDIDSDLSFYDNSSSLFFSTTTDILAIEFGGTGAASVAEARTNLELDTVYEFGVNSTGTDGQLWQSDGNGRGQWVSTSSLGIVAGASGSTFVGRTTYQTNGEISSSSYIGYVAANYICDAEFSGSHLCQAYDMISSIEKVNISGWGNNTLDAWISEGAPGYTVDSNDCNGYKDGTSSFLGAFWLFNSNGGGAGWMINCAQVKSLACCSD